MFPWNSELVFDSRGVQDLDIYYNERFTMTSWGTALDLTNVTGTVYFLNIAKAQHDPRELVVINDVSYSKSIFI